MRPQQQNRRMRGRNNNNNSSNNNNRKGPNPLTRSYESNGPDVKIRGSAQQIAEKYATLARDAMSAGDRVIAENYLQHAEHYNRIIAAAQAAMPIQNFQQNCDDFDDEDGEDRDDMDNQGNGDQPNVNGPQPVIEGMPAEVALNGDNGGQQNYRNRDRNDRNEGRNREGGDRDNRNREGREGRNRDFQSRNGDYQRRDFNNRDEQGGDQPGGDQPRGDQPRGDQPRAQQPRNENRGREGNQHQPVEMARPSVDEAPDNALPAFVTAPVPQAAPVAEVQEEAPRRVRRPRRPREAAAEGKAEEPAATEGAAGDNLAPVEN